MSGKSGYLRLGDTGTAILQKACELSSKPVVICRHTGKVDCFQCTAIFVCFQEIKVFAGKQTFFKYAVTIKFVALQYTTFE